MITVAEVKPETPAPLPQPMRQRMTGDEWRQWCLSQVKQEEDQRWNTITTAGDGKPSLFLPFLGEFGHRWMYHVRRVHFSTATEKVVCIQPGEEAMYPSATAFEYDWTNPIPDAEREGTDRIDQRMRDWAALIAKYPGLQPVAGGGLTYQLEHRCFHPGERIKFTPKTRGLRADVCIGTRIRGSRPRLNWPHAQLVADSCRKLGLTYATIAHPTVGYHLAGEVCMSGDYGDVDSSIELLQNCKFFFSTDTGVAHMASTVGVPMAVLTVPHRRWAEEENTTGMPLAAWGRDFIDRMMSTNAPFPCHRIGPEKWEDPAAVVDELMPMLQKISQWRRPGKKR